MNVVAHLTECKPNSTIASARVARFIVNTLGNDEDWFELVDTHQKAREFLDRGDTLKTLFIVNGPMAFCDFLEELADMVRMAEHVIFVQQDYTIMPPSATSKAESPFRKVFADKKLRPAFWTTVERNIVEPGDAYINWNQLTYDPHPLPDLNQAGILMYYGAYRQKREPAFREYFTNTNYLVRVSTTTLRGKKFKELDTNIVIVPPFDNLGKMPSCSASIYIEDPLSSKEFHSPANRFYELLSAGIPIFFDRHSLKMLARGGIVPLDEWVVDGKHDLAKKLRETDLVNMRRAQRKMWDKPYVAELQKRLLALWEDHKQNR